MVSLGFDYVTIYFAIISTYLWCDLTLYSSFSLIVAAPSVDAWSIVKEVFPLLSFSAPFVVYHQYLQVITRESCNVFNLGTFCYEINWLCGKMKKIGFLGGGFEILEQFLLNIGEKMKNADNLIWSN